MYGRPTTRSVRLALVILCHIVISEANRELVPTVRLETASRGTDTSQRAETTTGVLPVDSALQPSNTLSRGLTTPISSAAISSGGTKSAIPTSISPITDDAQASRDVSTYSRPSTDSGQPARQDSLSDVGNPVTLIPTSVQPSSMVTPVQPIQPVPSRPTRTPTKTPQLEPSSVDVQGQPKPSRIDGAQGQLSTTNWSLQPSPATVVLISRLQPQPTPAVIPLELSNGPAVIPTPAVDVQLGVSSRTIIEQAGPSLMLQPDTTTQTAQLNDPPSTVSPVNSASSSVVISPPRAVTDEPSSQNDRSVTTVDPIVTTPVLSPPVSKQMGNGGNSGPYRPSTSAGNPTQTAPSPTPEPEPEPSAKPTANSPSETSTTQQPATPPRGQSQTPESEPSPTPESDPSTTPKAEPSPTPEVNPPPIPNTGPQIPETEPSPTPEQNPPQIPNREPSPTPETNPPQIPNSAPSPTPEGYPPPTPETEPSPTAERAPPKNPGWSPDPNLEWTPKAEPEGEPTSEPYDPYGMGWEHIPWAEPEPKWDEAKETWRFWWFVHIYTFGGLFALLALYSLISMVRLTRKHLLSMGYFLALNFLMLLMGASRAVYLFVDAYNSLKLLHPALSYFLFSVGFPCMTSAFCLLYLALLQTTKMQAMSPKVYQTCVMVAIIVLHFGLSVATDLIIGFLGTAKILMLVCQGVFAIWGIILAFSYFFIFRRLYRSARHRMKELQRMNLSKSKLPGINPIKKKQKTRLGTAVKVTLVTAILGLLCSLLQVYAMVEVFGIFYKQPEPWPWWGFQTAFRLCEFLMCVTMSYVATQPFRFHKDGRPRDPCCGSCCYCCYRCCHRGEKIELDLPDGNAHHYSEFSCMTHSDGNLGNIHNPQGTKDIAEMIPMITMAPSDVQGSVSQASIIVEDNPTTDDEILENIEVQTLTTTYDNFASSEQDTRDEDEYDVDIEPQTRSEAEGTSNTTSPQHYGTDIDSPRHYVDMETSEEYLDADSSRQASTFDSPAHYADVDSPQHVLDIEIFQRDSDDTPSESNSISPSNSLIDTPLLDGNLDFEPPSPLNFRRSIDNVFTNMYTPSKSRSTFSLGITLRDFSQGSGKSDSDGETSLLTLSTTDNKYGDSTGPSSETQSPSKSRSMTELGAVGGNPKYKKNPGGAKTKPKILTSLPKFSRSSLSLGSNPSKQGYSQLDGEDSQSGESSRQDTLRRSFSDPQRRERDEMARGEGEGQESLALSGEPLSSPVSVQAELGHVCDAINGFAVEKDVADL
ncbi:Hypp3123 [Branchiostoma lanceolatum]|uniref:Hypp3123 protein n=1 Tax=Branchiostoma lanceolatum TaxID=7740 RepID=A0A8J9ZYC4_BRALA|nr:Hypp3123 [Branchiostoma lanceolatum]